MTFRLEIECENDVFCDDQGEYDGNVALPVLAHFLRAAAASLSEGTQNKKLADSNGNTVGKYEFIR